MGRYILFAVFLVLAISMKAQDFDRYQPMRNQGSLPDEFFTDRVLLSDSDLIPAQNSDSYELRKSRADYIRFSDFYIRILLRSGDLMFGDPLSTYVNRVADILLKDFPDLRSRFRFYVTRYPEVNAVCLPNGIVLVNIGLLAQLENEAQLAFVLAHEMIHYVKKHGIDAYIERDRILKNSGNYRSYSSDERMFAMMQYSRDLEFDADELGFLTYYKGSGYKLSEAEYLCDVLLYSDFPVDEVPYSRVLVEDSFFVLPARCWRDSIDPISVIEDYADEKMTHPNIKKRRERLHALIQTAPDEGAKYQLSREEFQSMREQARFELCNLYLMNRQYADAMYLVHILRQKHPESDYLTRVYAKACYGLARLVSTKETRFALRSPEKQKGESQRLFHLLRSFTNKELNIFACRELWKCHMKLPNDSIVLQMNSQAFDLLMTTQKISRSYFLFRPPLADSVDAAAATEVDSLEEVSKYDRIKTSQIKVSNVDPFQLAFLAFAHDEEFMSFFNRKLSKWGTTDVVTQRTYMHSGRHSDNEVSMQVPSIDRLIMLDPMYLRTFEHRNSNDEVLSSSTDEKEFLSIVSSMAKVTNMEVSILDPCIMNASDDDAYNDFQLLKSWYNEFSEDDTITTISYEQANLNALAENYNTPYVAVSGIWSERQQRNGLALMCSIVAPIVLPFSILLYLTPKYQTIYFFEIYDITTGRLVYREYRRIHGKDFSYTIKQMVFSTFNSIKG